MPSITSLLLRVPLAAIAIGTLGCTPPRGREPAPADTSDGSAVPSPPARDGAAPSSAWLALLPDGEEKRRFVLDCTGCHQFDARIARPNGVARSEAEWGAAVARMLRYAGPRTGFPVISAHQDSARTAAWLARALAAAPTPVDDGFPPHLVARSVVTEYDLPSARDLPHDVAVQRDGRVVVTGMFTHGMYVLDPATRAFEAVPIPVPNANPRAVEIDSLGTWWVVLGAPKMIARRAASTGAWRTFDVGVYPHSLAVGGGRVWYNGHFTHPK